MGVGRGGNPLMTLMLIGYCCGLGDAALPWTFLFAMVFGTYSQGYDLFCGLIALLEI